MKSRLGAILIFAASIGVRAGAASAAPVPEAYVSALEETLHHDTSYRMRLQAAVLLGRSQSARAPAALVEALSVDPHLVVRAGAAMALGVLRDHSGLTPLAEQAAYDPEILVRQEALQALDRFSAGEVVIALRRVYDRLPGAKRAPLFSLLMSAARDKARVRLQRAAMKVLEDVYETRRPG